MSKAVRWLGRPIMLKNMFINFPFYSEIEANCINNFFHDVETSTFHPKLIYGFEEKGSL
jgi:hypothetical protein